MMILKPSRWSGGISLLWNGIEASDVLDSFFSPPDKHLILPYRFAFDSARNALFHFLKSQGVGKGDTVAVFIFTCEAVTEAINALGCEIIFYNSDDNLENGVIPLEKDAPTVVIQQITFGKKSISNKTLEYFEKQGSIILCDKALSYGPSDFLPGKVYKYPTFFSFEVSKAITVGWGGVLVLPETQAEPFRTYYKKLKSVSVAVDIHRNIVLLLNAANTKRGSFPLFIAWIFCNALGLRRSSYRSSQDYSRRHSKPGIFTSRLIEYVSNDAFARLVRTNNNHQILKMHLESAGFKVISQANFDNSTPRVTFVCSNERRQFIRTMMRNGIECGVWFDRPPLTANEGIIEIKNNWNGIFKKYLNLPCHYTLSESNLHKIIKAIHEFKN